jgi:hypothetical protein
MSNTIDFLPLRYSEQNVKRRSRLWLLSILGLFACVIAVTFTIQMALHKQAKTQLTTIEFQHASAQATKQMFNQLQTRLATAQTSAYLYAYLERNWPRTQIIRAVATPLTDEITLSELTIAVEAEQAETRTRQTSRRRRGAPESNQMSGSPETSDLSTLQQQMAAKRTIVHLAGTTTDDVALHRYVSRLGNDALFANAELLSIESATGQQEAPSAEFLLRVTVRESDSPQAIVQSPVPKDARRQSDGSQL